MRFLCCNGTALDLSRGSGSKETCCTQETLPDETWGSLSPRSSPAAGSKSWNLTAYSLGLVAILGEHHRSLSEGQVSSLDVSLGSWSYIECPGQRPSLATTTEVWKTGPAEAYLDQGILSCSYSGDMRASSWTPLGVTSILPIATLGTKWTIFLPLYHPSKAGLSHFQ